MSVQTSYTRLQAVGYHGALADLNPREIVAHPAVAAVPFGSIVSRSGAGVAKGGTTPIGVALRDLTRQANTAGSSDVEYDDEEAVNIARKGYVYLTIAAGGSAGDALLSNDTTGVIDVGTAGAGETQLNATLEEAAAAGAVALCRIQL